MHRLDDNLFVVNNRESTLNTVSGIATDCSGTKAERATKLCNNAFQNPTQHRVLIFLNATLRAAVHLEQDYEANLRYVKKNLWNSVGQLFNEKDKLISEQTEITGVSSINFKELT